MMKNFDLIIIGGGSAGFGAAMKADELKAKTLMINNDSIGLGGTCVNVGCVPTKHLLHIGELLHKIRRHNLKGLDLHASTDFKTIIEEKNKLIETLRNEKYEKVLKELHYIEFTKGNAELISKNKIKTNEQIYETNKIIIATGSSTFIPNIKGINKIDYLTNIEALQPKESPKSMIILGGGALGLEFAQIFSRFGAKVCLVQRAERIAKREEPELALLLQKYLQDEGIEICTKARIQNIKQENNDKIIEATVDGKKKTFRGEQLLIATGRRPNTSNIGLEKLGITLGEKGEITVNDQMMATANVWAAGDVTGEPMLETVAAKEGMIAAHNALSNAKKSMNYRIVPHAIFTDPQLAGVGLTDEQAIQQGITCRCNTIPMELVPKAQAIKDTRGAVKIVINDKTQEIIGMHILAPEAADLMHEGVMIVRNRMTIDEVIDTLHIFPTLSEAIKITAQSFRRDVEKMSCCGE